MTGRVMGLINYKSDERVIDDSGDLKTEPFRVSYGENLTLGVGCCFNVRIMGLLTLHPMKGLAFEPNLVSHIHCAIFRRSGHLFCSSS